ncbi:hypothetical protein KI387_026723, partial [Taxus chinensis]
MDENTEEDDVTLVVCLTKMKVGKGIDVEKDWEKFNRDSDLGEASASRKMDCVGDPNVFDEWSRKMLYLEGVLKAMEASSAGQRDSMMEIINISKKMVTDQVQTKHRVNKMENQVKVLLDRVEMMELGNKRRKFNLRISISEEEMDNGGH